MMFRFDLDKFFEFIKSGPTVSCHTIQYEYKGLKCDTSEKYRKSINL